MQDLAAHIMDIAQNSVRAGARRVEIAVVARAEEDTLTVRVTDDGKGMSAETLARVTDPFFTSRTTRRVGLGIPLLKQNAERTGGRFSIRSREGAGTTVEAVFGLRDWDRPPLGDAGGTVALLASANPGMEVVFRMEGPGGRYVFDTREIREVLGDVPLNDPEVTRALVEMARENVKDLKVT